MASVPNPFAATTPIGQAISNLGTAIFSGPSPAEAEKARIEREFLLARTGKANADAEAKQNILRSQAGISNLIGQVPAMRSATAAPVADPGVAGPARAQAATATEGVRGDARQFLGDLPLNLAAQGGGLVGNPQDLGNLFRFATANDPTSTDDAVIRSLAGAGQTIGVNDAVSLGGQDRVRAANVTGDIAINDAKPRTLSQVKAESFQGLPSDVQALAIGPTFANVRGQAALDTMRAASGGPGVPDDTRTIGMGAQAFGPPNDRVADPNSPSGITLTPRPQAAGQPGVAPAAANKSDLGLTTASRTAAQGRSQSLRDYQSLSATVRDIGSRDPALFGIVGGVRRLGQNIVQQIENVSLVSGGGTVNDALAQAEADIARATNGNYDVTVFNPDLSDIDKMATLLAYNAASALAGQSGRDLSDKDFKAFRNIVGDPTSFFASQKAFLSGLDRLDAQVAARLENTPGAALSGLGEDDDSGEGDVLQFDENGELIQ